MSASKILDWLDTNPAIVKKVKSEIGLHRPGLQGRKSVNKETAAIKRFISSADGRRLALEMSIYLGATATPRDMILALTEIVHREV